MPLATPAPGRPRGAGSGCSLKRLTPEETQAHREGGRGVGGFVGGPPLSAALPRAGADGGPRGGGHRP